MRMQRNFSLVVILAVVASTTALAQTQTPAIGPVGRPICSMSPSRAPKRFFMSWVIARSGSRLDYFVS